jgi:CRISPR/Cas system-associated exonuclease Cas4 (RecB family)
MENLISKLVSRPRSMNLDVNKLVRKLNKEYVKSRKNTTFKTKKSFSPSTVGYGYGTCPRYWNLAFKGSEFDESWAAPNIIAMMTGTDAHERIQKKIEEMGILEGKEIEVKNEDPPIRGFVDIIINDEGNRAVGEIKTIKAEQFYKRKDEGVPSDSHFIQTLIYMKVLNIPEGFVLYEDKNNHFYTASPILMNEKNSSYAEYIFDWMREVYKAHKEEKNVSRPFSKSSTVCKYCPLNRTCYESSNGRTKIPPLEVKVP